MNTFTELVHLGGADSTPKLVCFSFASVLSEYHCHSNSKHPDSVLQLICIPEK
jgi:hypothetical protein